MIFLADSVAARETHVEAIRRSAQYIAHFEPITLLSALADGHRAHRARLDGVDELQRALPHRAQVRLARFPQQRSRRLEHRHLGTRARSPQLQPRGALRARGALRRAREFTDVVLGLWDSWDDDAFVRDKESGLFFDPEKLHVLNHKGKYFQVRGPLNVPRPPQGHPVLVQAGSSRHGPRLRRRIRRGDLHGAPARSRDAQEFYADIKARVAATGRNPDHVKILPGSATCVGRTQAEAQEKFDYHAVARPPDGRARDRVVHAWAASTSRRTIRTDRSPTFRCRTRSSEHVSRPR